MNLPSKFESNNPKRAGQRASNAVFFGPNNRFAIFAVHTRFEAVTWFAQDAERCDSIGMPLILTQQATFAAAREAIDANIDFAEQKEAEAWSLMSDFAEA